LASGSAFRNSGVSGASIGDPTGCFPIGHSDIAVIQQKPMGVQVHFQEYEEARSLLEQITAEQRGAFNDTVRFAMLLLDHAEAGAS
jgi:hypothetical protein